MSLNEKNRDHTREGDEMQRDLPGLFKSKRGLTTLALLGGAAVVGGSAYEIFCPRATWFNKVKIHGRRDRNSVSLIFDRQPNESTDILCKKMHQLEVPATFFIEGQRAEDPLYRSTLKRLSAFEVEVHGQVYNPLIFRNKSSLLTEFSRAIEIATDIQDRRPRFLLPPYGWKDLRLISAARESNLTVVNPSKVIRLPAHSRVDQIMRDTKHVVPGDIILIRPLSLRRNDRGFFGEALDMIVDGLRQKGLRFWGLSPLLE